MSLRIPLELVVILTPLTVAAFEATGEGKVWAGVYLNVPLAPVVTVFGVAVLIIVKPLGRVKPVLLPEAQTISPV